MRRWRSALAALLAAVLTACASAPPRESSPSGPQSARPPVDADEDGLLYATAQAEKQLQASPLLERDAELNAYVHALACAVAGPGCADLRVYIVEVPAFNANMAPNGMLQLWSGLLLRCEDEAQLAFVLGHEIGHYRERHTLAQWRRLKATESWLGVVQIFTIGVGAGLVGELATLAGYANVLAFSREQERSADRAGFQVLQQRGYAPQAAPELFAGLLDEERAREKNKPSSIFATHPATAERVATLRELAAGEAVGPADRGRDRYLAATRGLRMGWLRGELGRRHDAQTLVLLDRLRSRADDPAPGELDYAKAEVLRRRNRADDADQAIGLFRRAAGEEGAPAETHRDLGLLLRSRGEHASARASFEHYLQLQPQAADRALIEHYLGRLQP